MSKQKAHYVDNDMFYKLLFERRKSCQTEETILMAEVLAEQHFEAKAFYLEEKRKFKKLNEEMPDDHITRIDYELTKESLEEYSTKFDRPAPRVSNAIGKIILDIATNQCFRPNFITYAQYHEEMTGDNIENCLRYIDNFDPYQYKNPFAYFTQICFYASVRRIMKEKKQTTIKQSIYDKQGIEIENATQFVERYNEDDDA